MAWLKAWCAASRDAVPIWDLAGSSKTTSLGSRVRQTLINCEKRWRFSEDIVVQFIYTCISYWRGLYCGKGNKLEMFDPNKKKCAFEM